MGTSTSSSSSASYTQTGRPMWLETTLGKDKLLLESFSGQESVSGLFHFTLELVSKAPDVAAESVVRTPATIHIALAEGGSRPLHGIVSRFVQLGQKDGMTSYRAELVPWLWLLSLSSTCRTFQAKTVPDIVKQVFQDAGFSDFKFKLVKKDWQPRDYCVQYRETHFDFVSRLLEDEGIYYFFEHEAGKHTMILVDDKSMIVSAPGASVVNIVLGETSQLAKDGITQVELERSACTSAVALTDFNPLTPSTGLMAKEGKKDEFYDYPGQYAVRAEGDRYAKIRLQERLAFEVLVRGDGSSRRLRSGYKFDLDGHYRGPMNRPYFVLSVSHMGTGAGHTTGDSSGFVYRSAFVAMPHATQYRPPRAAPKPRVYGSQTAIVVGPAGEEIHTDEYGRVKVQFHWDREGKKDEKSSCWVRVSSTWAGKGWGQIEIPRIGQEVVVDFLEGDPDRPIITGRVYNAEQMPPYALPAKKTQSGVKSRSTKGGTTDNFNEIRFEDEKGKEEVYIHAEKDKKVVVENDNSEMIGNDEAIDVKKNQSVSVGKNQSITVGDNRTLSVGKNETISIEKNRSESVGESETVSVGKNRGHDVGQDESLNVGGKRSLSVDKDETIAVHGVRSTNIGKDDKLEVGKNLVITVADQITLATGDASITMKKNGDIVIKGKNLTLEGSAKITVKASSDLVLKGSKIGAN
jgi:type VI secretion system secreted protein VgrG